MAIAEPAFDVSTARAGVARLFARKRLVAFANAKAAAFTDAIAHGASAGHRRFAGAKAAG